VIKKLALLLTLGSLASAAYPEDDWVFVGTSYKDDVYMKMASVKVNNDLYNSVDTWVKYISISDDSSVVARMKYYCKSDSFQQLEAHNYDKDGNYLYGRKNPASIQRAIPDTIGVDLVNSACVSGAVSDLLMFHYMDNEDITDAHYKQVIDKFGSYSVPAMIYYNKKTGNTN